VLRHRERDAHLERLGIHGLEGDPPSVGDDASDDAGIDVPIGLDRADVTDLTVARDVEDEADTPGTAGANSSPLS
jgi:hypothetical protein